MRKISANHILPVGSAPLKNGIITLDETGTITGLTDTGGDLRETGKLEFFNGVITPGFVLPCFPLQGRLTAPYTFNAPDTWFRDNGIAGVGVIERSGRNFRDKQLSPVIYHTIVELCPEPDDEFEAFRSCLEAVTGAWNEYGQACSVSGCPGSWTGTDLSKYLLEYISTHRAVLVLRDDPEYPVKKQLGALELAWERLSEGQTRTSGALPGNLLVIGSGKNRKPGPFTTSIPIQVFRFPGFRPRGRKALPGWHTVEIISEEIQPDSEESPGRESVTEPPPGNLNILTELLRMQEELPGTGLVENLPTFTLDPARALFMDETLGCIEPGKKPGLNLITGVEPRGDGLLRLTGDSSLRIL